MHPHRRQHEQDAAGQQHQQVQPGADQAHPQHGVIHQVLGVGQDGGPLGRDLLLRQPQEVDGPLHPALPAYRLRQGLALPLFVRELPVGVLVVELPEGEVARPERHTLLSAVAHQAALALWSTRMCVERAHKLAVQEERSRIAQEIYDTVSQGLFSAVYTLQNCSPLLSEEQRTLRERLESVLRTSTKTLQETRRLVHDLWVGGLTTAEFVAELRSTVQDLGALEDLQVDITVEGDLTELTPFTRKHLFPHRPGSACQRRPPRWRAPSHGSPRRRLSSGADDHPGRWHRV